MFPDNLDSYIFRNKIFYPFKIEGFQKILRAYSLNG